MSKTVKVKLGNKDYPLVQSDSEIDLVECTNKVNEMFDMVRADILPPRSSEQDVAAVSAINFAEEVLKSEIDYKKNLAYLENELSAMSKLLSEALS